MVDILDYKRQKGENSMKTIIAFALLFAVSAQAQSFKFYWNDRWNSHEPGLFYFDKLDHLAANAVGFWTLKKVGIESPRYRFLIVTGLSVGWEIRDGFRHKKTGGFSFHDLAAGMAGQVLVFGAEQLFDKPKTSSKYDEALRQELQALELRVVELERRNTDKIGDTLE